jgi:hypothetical protein
MLGMVVANGHTFGEGSSSLSPMARMQPWLHHLHCFHVGLAAGTSPQQLPILYSDDRSNSAKCHTVVLVCDSLFEIASRGVSRSYDEFKTFTNLKSPRGPSWRLLTTELGRGRCLISSDCQFRKVMRMLASDLDRQIQVCSCAGNRSSCLTFVCGVVSATLTTQLLMIVMRQETIKAPMC